MNGKTADPSVININIPRRIRIMKIGANHHIFVSFRKRKSSFTRLSFPMMYNHYLTNYWNSQYVILLDFPRFSVVTVRSAIISRKTGDNLSPVFSMNGCFI